MTRRTRERKILLMCHHKQDADFRRIYGVHTGHCCPAGRWAHLGIIRCGNAAECFFKRGSEFDLRQVESEGTSADGLAKIAHGFRNAKMKPFGRAGSGGRCSRLLLEVKGNDYS